MTSPRSPRSASQRLIAPINTVPEDVQQEINLAAVNYRIFSNMEKEASSARRAAGDILLSALARSELDGVILPEFTVLRIQSSRSTIDRKRLLERGVSPDIILYATVTSESSPYINIRDNKGSKDTSDKDEEAQS